jgi:hypothetical protein
VSTAAREARRAMRRAVAAESALFPAEMQLIAETFAGSTDPGRVWRSRTHLAMLYTHEGHSRLTVQRVTDAAFHPDRDPKGGISWDELQRIKSECGFGGWWAVEVYPPDPEVVDVAPMRHLWLLGAVAPPYAWRKALQ